MKKTAFMFCGGGAQYPGMMKDLYFSIPDCKKVFDEADSILGKKLSEEIFSGSEEQLKSTSVMIPAIYTCDIAAGAALLANGVAPEYMLGFSLGEWAALTSAGVISFKDGISIVQFRAEAMERSAPKEGGGMGVILKKPNKYVEELCASVKKGHVYPANYNYEGQIAVSGDNEGLDELSRIAEAKFTIYDRLPVNIPSHCIMMKAAMEELEHFLEKIEFKEPMYPIVSNATGQIGSDVRSIRRNAIEQLIKPVLFEQSIKCLLDEGVECFIELGPGITLSKFVAKIAKKSGKQCEVYNVEDMYSLKITVAACGL